MTKTRKNYRLSSQALQIISDAASEQNISETTALERIIKTSRPEDTRQFFIHLHERDIDLIKEWASDTPHADKQLKEQFEWFVISKLMGPRS